MIKDSGNRTEFNSGAVRDIQEGKGRCDLLPLDIIDLWCDDGLHGTLYYVDEYLKNKGTTDYFELVLNEFAIEHQAKRIASGENVQNKLYSVEEYRWNLVLELAKHFEEGAKKYGDRNWEKGIPCDRYIDSAVRHYCKWRAGWTDEPHDRAFIWNIVCCEWTRQRYGWNLERLEKKSDSAIRDDSSDTKMTPAPHNVLGMSTSLLRNDWLAKGVQDSLRLSDGAEFAMTVDCDFSELAKVLGIEEPKEKDQETADLKSALDDVERYNACYNTTVDKCPSKSCSKCNRYIDPADFNKAVNKLYDYVKKSLGNTEENE